ncbi:GNAT family N-acetyltransferase [Actinophytocola sp. NPDC049390]|uniref:GNAT family N-acetyltransferase n=1 Tax=Actinophytocola sp. NPDC049390 TaxID=3363894 RepID=UPI0037B95DA0
MDDLRIRRARWADREILIRELGQERLFDDHFSRQHDRRGMLLAGWRNGRPIGVIYLWLEDAEEPELREYLHAVPILNHLEIHSDHRGGGAGTALVLAAERRLRRLRCHRVALAVELSNYRAALLYKRLGYEEWAHGPVKCYSLADNHGVRHAELCQVMVKSLREA